MDEFAPETTGETEGFDHESCRQVFDERRHGPVCKPCVDHATAIVTEFFEAAAEAIAYAEVQREDEHEDDTTGIEDRGDEDYRNVMEDLDIPRNDTENKEQ